MWVTRGSNKPGEMLQMNPPPRGTEIAKCTMQAIALFLTHNRFRALFFFKSEIGATQRPIRMYAIIPLSPCLPNYKTDETQSCRICWWDPEKSQHLSCLPYMKVFRSRRNRVLDAIDAHSPLSEVPWLSWHRPHCDIISVCRTCAFVLGHKNVKHTNFCDKS